MRNESKTVQGISVLDHSNRVLAVGTGRAQDKDAKPADKPADKAAEAAPPKKNRRLPTTP
jgi:hypothetical protein